MKKLMIGFAAVMISFSAISQTTKSTTFSIGAELSLPVGTFADAYGVGFGGSAQAEFKPTSDLGLTLNAGYLHYSLKSSLGLGSGNLGLIPVMAGAKYYFSRGAYAHAQLGAGFGSSKYDNYPASSSNYTNFIYSPGLGYNFTPGIDAELKYFGISNKGGGSSSSVGLRVAYSF